MRLLWWLPPYHQKIVPYRSPPMHSLPLQSLPPIFPAPDILNWIPVFHLYTLGWIITAALLPTHSAYWYLWLRVLVAEHIPEALPHIFDSSFQRNLSLTHSSQLSIVPQYPEYKKWPVLQLLIRSKDAVTVYKWNFFYSFSASNLYPFPHMVLMYFGYFGSFSIFTRSFRICTMTVLLQE